jgi:hypothetical protein
MRSKSNESFSCVHLQSKPMSEHESGRAPSTRFPVAPMGRPELRQMAIAHISSAIGARRGWDMEVVGAHVPVAAQCRIVYFSANRTRYTDDTQSIHSFVFPTALRRALRCDRCLAITT